MGLHAEMMLYVFLLLLQHDVYANMHVCVCLLFGCFELLLANLAPKRHDIHRVGATQGN